MQLATDAFDEQIAPQRYKESAGVQHGTIHTFRHVFCSFLANAKL